MHDFVTVRHPSAQNSAASEGLALGPWPALVLGQTLPRSVSGIAANAHCFGLQILAQPYDQLYLMVDVLVAVHEFDCVRSICRGFDVSACGFEEKPWVLLRDVSSYLSRVSGIIPEAAPS